MNSNNSNIRISRISKEQREKNCGYYWLITVDASSHKAFDTIQGVAVWLFERGLGTDKPLKDEVGNWQVVGSYREESHSSFEGIENVVMETRTLSNGSYTKALITEDRTGMIRTVNTINPNYERITYDYKESNKLMGGNHTSTK